LINEGLPCRDAAGGRQGVPRTPFGSIRVFG
jgi:hypothetical protein